MRRVISPVLGLAVAIAITATACGGSEESPDAGLSPSCIEADNHSDIDWLEDNVFTPSCAAFSACHKGRALSAEELNLEKGNVEKNLVGVPHHEFTDQILVVPGSPEQSYLLVLIGLRSGTLNDKGTMPLNNPRLCKPKQEAISRWISNLSPAPDAGVADAGATDDAAPADAAGPDA